MNGAEVLDVGRDAIWTLILIASPMMLVGLVVGVVVWKAAKRKPKREIAWGAPCGLTLGPFLGAITVIPLINAMGNWFIGPFFPGVHF